MKLDNVAVLGGGPGGLYAARLLKMSHPDARVTVYEQGVPDKTFGFGVGLASRTQRNLRLADESSLNAIVAASHPHEMSMRVDGDEVRLAHGELLAVGRAKLLSVLQECAREVGVDLQFGQRREAAEFADADLVIAADGINSATREANAEAFEPTIAWGDGLYLWCGTDFALPSAIFTPVTTEHGTFVAHAYPYSDDQSTFLIETDEETFRRAGFDRSTEATPATESDQTSLDYLSEAFADPLQGHKLIGNRTRWMRFRTIRCKSWHVGNTVLLGDAAHTAHYSIGSGTKLAMEDAIALDQAILAHDDLDSAFASYEETRRPDVEHLQAIAERSMVWWDHFPQRTGMPVEQLMIAYMTRAGKVSLAKFATSASSVAAPGLARFARCDAGDVPVPDEITDWVLALPGEKTPSRLAPAELRDAASTSVVPVVDRPWSAETRNLLAALPESEAYWLVGADDRETVLDRLDVAEQIRRSTDATVIAEVPAEYRDDAAAAVASERVDLVCLTG